jgi:hypothetical protein
VWAESAGKNQGSTFYIRLPLNKDLVDGAVQLGGRNLAEG